MKNRIVELLIALIAVAAVFVGLWLIFLKKPVAQQAVIVRPVLTTPVKLRIAHIVNPRFASLDDAQIKRFIDTSIRLTKEHFNIDVEFEWVGRRNLADLVQGIPEQVKEYKKPYIVHPIDMSKGMRQSLDTSLISVLKTYSSSLSELQEFSQQYLIEPPGRTYETFANSLTETLLYRQNYWRKVKALDGLPVINKDPYHEWVIWDSLGYGQLDFDVAITNQLVASVEAYGMDMHSSLRGGITLGTTSNSTAGNLGGFAWVSTFPVLNDHPQIMILRNEQRYSAQQKADYAAAVLAHELGHLLLHISHPWGQAGCIMAPVPLLNYSEWYDQLDGDVCRQGKHPMNQIGSAKITYDLID